MSFDKAALAAFLVLTVLPSVASAQSHEDPIVEATMPRPRNTLELVGTAGAAANKAAFAASVGARMSVAEDWKVGLHAEINPYTSATAQKVRPGSANFFTSIDYRWIQQGRVGLSTIGYAGVSWLLFDLYGVPAGSVGPFIGLTPLAAEVRVGGRTTLLIESVRLAAPIPHLTGVPYSYPQYRFSLGIAIALD